MVEIAISVAAKIAEYLVAPIGRPFRYLWNYKTNLENLKNEVDELKGKRDSVESLIRVGEEPLPHVEKWQKSANQTIVEASKVVEDNPEQANIQCFKGFSCPNLMNRYQLSKKAADKLRDVVRLEQQAIDFNEVSYPTIPEQPTLQPRKGDVAFESRKSILKGIIDVLRDPDVNMVGIYGMGGVGKTTLAREVASEAKQHSLFDKIVFVEVSESPDIKNIQGVIADHLALQFKEETVPGRASRLFDQLKKEGKVLLILDNIWKGIDFVEVGIPFKSDHKGLKLLLTTRSRDVLTNQMDSKCNFSIATLKEAEAWSLFKNTAGMCTEQPDLKSIAHEVAKECGGMPLAIVAIANALKNKGETIWRNALEELKNPSSENFEGKMTKNIYTIIKLSYDYLDSEELREIFLLCSYMGRTYDASIRDLFRYGLGLGFFKRFNTLEKAQCKVEDLVKQLKDNSLLLDALNETRESHRYGIPDSERFAMHDVICDVARSIAFGKENVCIVIDDVISCSWAKHNILKNCNSITLHNIGELPKDLKLVLPQLKFFYMKPKNTFSRITDDFFTDISSLLVLHLIEMNLSPLPTSLSHLVNLQTLCLDACKLGDIADVGKLEKLEFLSFCGSEIRELPKEMCQLTSIRLLDLTNCSELEIIPPNLLSCFTQLEALYMYNTLIMWEVRGLNIGRILEELKHLRDRLTTLEISIPNVKMSEGLLTPHLKRYKISIDRNQISPPMNSRTLRVKLNTNDNANEVISQLEGIKQLELVAASRDDSESRDDDSKQSVSLDALFSLESLSLQDLNFEKICNVPLAAESFCQLRTITVDGCDKLTKIFSFSIDRVLPKLQEIRVSDCKNMEGIFAIEREDDVNNSELIHEIQFRQLCSVTLRHLPQLKSFCHTVKTTSQLQLTSSPNDGEIISEDMSDNPNPKSLFNEKVVFPNLKTLEISNINAKKIWHNQLPMMSSFQNLNRLDVLTCYYLKELFPSSMVNSFVQLRYLYIYGCSLLEEVVFMEELKEEERKDTQFPFLTEMRIEGCPNFKAFISNDKIGFPSLKAMGIFDCPKFKEFIFNDKVAVPKIEKLTISYMDNLEKIWHNQLVKDSFCKLKSLDVLGCKKLLNVFPSNIYGRLLSLESLEVSRCDSLEEIFDLRELSIYDSRIMPSFENLQKLRVTMCGSLKNLFSTSSILGKEGVVMEEAPARFLFHKLTSLELDRLPELISFYPSRHKVEGPVLKTSDLSHSCIHDTDEEGQMQQPFLLSLVEEIGFPSLKEMEIRSCPTFKEFIFNDKVVVPNLEKLKISWMDNLEKIWHNQLVKDSFCKLKSLEVERCKKLLNVFPSNICGRLLSLESLEVSRCDSLEEIFDLRELSIYDSQIMSSFENLQNLRVTMCGSLKNLFSASILAKEGVVMKEAPARFLFPKLTSLELDDLPQLRSFYPGRHKVEGPILKTLDLLDCGTNEEGQPFFFSLVEEIGFPSLKEMKIRSCPTFKEFIFNDKVAAPNIEKLRISFMDNLEKIWHNQLVMDSFCKLKSLEVSYCRKLLNVFPSNICGRLLNLESLEVNDCDSLEEIFDLRELNIYDSQIMLFFENLQNLRVSICGSLKNLFSASILAKEGVVMEEAPARFLFPKLTSFQLFGLLQLRSFYPGRHTVEGPVLKALHPVHCGIHGILSFVEQAFPCLEELSLDGVHFTMLTMLCQGQFLESLFDKIKILQVNNDQSIFPFGIIQRCQNLEELSLFKSHYKEIFPHGEDQTQTKIKTLHLSWLFDLKYIWKQNSKLDLIIQNLEVLKVSWCPSLINLMQPPTSFQNLTSLGVDSSNSLINIGASSVAKSLVQLTEMSISFCKKITEVIGYHGDVIEDEIIFRKLKSLMLENLPSLKSFCSWNLTLKFPSLETLTVQGCQNLKIFSQRDLTTEKLQKVKIDQLSVELCPAFNLNTAIQQSHKKANASRKPISLKDNGASSSHHPVLMAGPAVVQE